MRECRYTSGDGLRLFYRAYGPADSAALPVLCLPGLTRHSGDFAGLATRLAAAGRRVVCPDLRGRGRSEYARDWRTYDPAYYLDDIRALLALEQIGRAVIVGTSMGGLLAMAMGVAMPSVLAGIVINDVGPDIRNPTGRALPGICGSCCRTFRSPTRPVGCAWRATPTAKARTACCISTGMYRYILPCAAASIPISTFGRSGVQCRICLFSLCAAEPRTCFRPRHSPA